MKLTKAYVLMTAMPPTKGHRNLIAFAANFAQRVEVIVCTQPDEPYAFERLYALENAFAGSPEIHFNHIHKELPQEPEVAIDFWEMWAGFLLMFGIQSGDFIVASETYGRQLASITNTRFMPYDPGRELLWSKATEVRRAPRLNFEQILPEFQPYLRKRITLFGAESTGKTTLSRQLAKRVNGAWTFEWARPYLETVSIDITTQAMEEIWHGQSATQRHAEKYLATDKPFIIQDTDLFSTVGYWDMWDMGTPTGLIDEAKATASDLYLITQSNIPFERDPIRYGGDKRESVDQYWIDLCENYGLNYKVIASDNLQERLVEAEVIVNDLFDSQANLAYERIGN